MSFESPPIESCPQCGTQLAASVLACPGCARLVHGERLTALATAAQRSAEAGDASTALENWREALTLLPSNSRQHQIIAAKITELGEQVPFVTVYPAPARGEKRPGGWGVATGIGALGLMAWKLKALAFGLTKGTTLLSMLLSLGVYWTLWGWKFALGIVLSIYVHEMGHVIALRRLGFKSTSPMFIPGLGALIRLQQKVVNPNEDAVIGLAGPIYGLGAALAALGLWYATDNPIFAAIGGVGALINLFNLLPISMLDGGRGFHAMSRLQKFLCAATVAGAWFFCQDGMLGLLTLVCVGRAIGDRSPPGGNWKAALTYIALVIALSAAATARLYIDLPE